MSKRPGLTDVETIEVEIDTDDGLKSVALLVSTIRGARGRRKLYGEASLYTSKRAHISFRIPHAKTPEDLERLFVKQLIHRGFVPRRVRLEKSGAYEGWAHVDLAQFDMKDHEEASTPMSVDED